MSCKSMNITKFVMHHEQRTSEMQDIEAAKDYKPRAKPKFFILDYGVLKHIVSAYTRRIYTEFQHKFLQEKLKEQQSWN